MRFFTQISTPLSAARRALPGVLTLLALVTLGGAGCDGGQNTTAPTGAAGDGGSGASTPTGGAGGTGGIAGNGGAGGTGGTAGDGGTGGTGGTGAGGTGGGRGSLCDDTPPVFDTAAPTTAVAGALYSYAAEATDPQGKAVTYMAKTDTFLTVNALTGLVQWLPTAADVGSHEIVLVATDSIGCVAEQSFTLQVTAENHAPEITSEAPFLAKVGQPYTYDVVAKDADGDALTFELNGAPGGMTVNGAGKISWTPGAGDAGTHTITVKVSDSKGGSDTQVYTLGVGSGAGGSAPTVSLSSPAALAEVTGFAPVQGTVQDTDLLLYFIDVCDEDGLQCEKTFEGKTSVVNGLLGRADTGGIDNGLAVIRVRAYDQAGNQASAQQKVRVAGGLKLGSVEVSVLDLEVESPGMPLRVVRSYSSLRRRDSQSFGHGWQLDIADGYKLERSRPDGEGWEAELGSFLDVDVSENGDPHYFVFQTPAGKNEVFAFFPEMQYGGIGLFDVTPKYFDIFDQGGSLAPKNDPGWLIYENGGSGTITNDSFELFAPDEFTITTADGTQYDVHREKGLEQLRDTRGNALTVSDSQIAHSNGRAITIARDGSGRITSVQDPAGNQIKYSYDAAGDLVKVEKPEGVVETYTYLQGHLLHDVIGIDGGLLSRKEYDDRGRIVKDTNAEGFTRTFSYDDPTSTQTITDAGGPVKMKYGSRGEILSVTDPASQTSQMVYDAAGRVIQKKDPAGGTYDYTYDARGNLLTATVPHAAGAPASSYTTYNTYDAQNRLTSTTTPGGAQVHFTYDGAGNLVEMKDEANNVLFARTYGPGGVVKSSLEPLGAAFNNTHNPQGDVIGSTDPFGGVTSATRDPAGRITSMSYANGLMGTFDLDGLGRPKAEHFSNGIDVAYELGRGGEWEKMSSPTTGELQRSFTLQGRVKEYKDATGHEQSYLYDSAGRLAAQIDPLGRVTLHEFGPDARPSAIVHPDGTKSTMERDALGRVTKETGPDGASYAFTYTPAGKLASATNPLGEATTFTYTPTSITSVDPLSRQTVSQFSPQGLLTKITFHDGATRQFTYLGGNSLQKADEYPTSIQDEGGHVRTFGYDTKARLTSATNLAGNAYTYTYQGSEVATVTSPTGEVTSFDRDDFDRVTVVHHPDGTETSYTYDVGAQPATTTHADGSTIDATYDQAGQLVGLGTSDGESIAFAYDAARRLVSMTDGAGATTFGYDLADHVTDVKSPDGAQVSYERDAAGRATAVMVRASAAASEQKTEYTYDAAGRLASMTDPLGGTTTWAYDKAGRVTTRTLPNGVVSKYTYDARDRVLAVVHEKNGAPLASAAYTRSGSGEPTSITYDDGAASFSYDAALRLTGEAYTGAAAAQASYGYDASGKRTSRTTSAGTTTYTYGQGYRLASTSGGGDDQTMMYDANGRVSQIARDGQQLGVEYNVFDRVRKVTVDGAAIDYTYDGKGNRTSATGPGGERRFVVADAMGRGLSFPHAIADGAGQVLVSYVYAGDMPVLRIGKDGKPVYYLEDAQGSVMALADESGAKVASFRYDAFGRVLAASGEAVGSPESAGGDFRFHGAWLEEDTGLYHMRARDYDPRTGRFLTRDPEMVDLNQPESHHPYAYAWNNPALYADPTGAFSIVSVNISVNFSSMMQNIQTAAVQAIKEELKDRIVDFFAQIALNAVFSFLPPGWGTAINAVLDDKTGLGGSTFADAVTTGICGIAKDNLDFVHFSVFIRGSSSSDPGSVAFDGFNCDTHSEAAVKNVRDNQVDPHTGLKIGKLNEADFILSDRKPSAGGAWLIGDFKAKTSTIKLNKTQAETMAIYARKHAMHIMAYVVWKHDRGRGWELTQLKPWAITHAVQVSIVSLME